MHGLAFSPSRTLSFLSGFRSLLEAFQAVSTQFSVKDAPISAFWPEPSGPCLSTKKPTHAPHTFSLVAFFRLLGFL